MPKRKAQNRLSDGHAQDIHSIDGEPSTNYVLEESLG